MSKCNFCDLYLWFFLSKDFKESLLNRNFADYHFYLRLSKTGNSHNLDRKDLWDRST